MLQTKPQGHWPFGSGEEDFWRVFIIYGHGGHLGHVTQPCEQTFVPPSHWGSIWKLALTGPAVLEKIFENGGRTDDGPWLYYKLTNEPEGSGELKATEKRWRHRFPHYKSMGTFCRHGNQSFDPICPQTLCSLSPTQLMLHIKFDQVWPTSLKDIQVSSELWQKDTMTEPQNDRANPV